MFSSKSVTTKGITLPEVIVKIVPIKTTISDKNCVSGTVMNFFRFVDNSNINKNAATIKQRSKEISNIPDVISDGKVNPM